ERIAHGFTEVFNNIELEQILFQRIHDYEETHKRCEIADTAEEALDILTEYTEIEARKRLPYAERYLFADIMDSNADDAYLGFYIFMRSRELVAIRRWFGEAGFTLCDAIDETIEQVFGGMNIDIID